jgi:hypothetical protein
LTVIAVIARESRDPVTAGLRFGHRILLDPAGVTAPLSCGMTAKWNGKIEWIVRVTALALADNTGHSAFAVLGIAVTQ